jgi:hypothetical protein
VARLASDGAVRGRVEERQSLLLLRGQRRLAVQHEIPLRLVGVERAQVARDRVDDALLGHAGGAESGLEQRGICLRRDEVLQARRQVAREHERHGVGDPRDHVVPRAAEMPHLDDVEQRRGHELFERLFAAVVREMRVVARVDHCRRAPTGDRWSEAAPRERHQRAVRHDRRDARRSALVVGREQNGRRAPGLRAVEVRGSTPPRTKSWHVAHATVPVDDSCSSKKSVMPSNSLPGV